MTAHARNALGAAVVGLLLALCFAWPAGWVSLGGWG